MLEHYGGPFREKFQKHFTSNSNYLSHPLELRTIIIQVPITKCVMRRNKIDVRVNTLWCADILLTARKKFSKRGFIF